MMDRPSDQWPYYTPAPTEHLYALGVISLTYGHLEGMYQVLFSHVTGMDRAQVRAIFQRIPNNTRQSVFLELLDQSPIPDNIKSLAKDFAEAFRICADNRHGLMHSHSGGLFVNNGGDPAIVFTKFSRAGDELVCTPTITDLRSVADLMHDLHIFAAYLADAINTARLANMPAWSTWLPPSLGKCPEPALLHWRRESDFQEETHQP